MRKKGQKWTRETSNKSRTWNSYRYTYWKLILAMLSDYQVHFLWGLLKDKEEKRKTSDWPHIKGKEFGNTLVCPANKLIERWKEEESRTTNSLSRIESEQGVISPDHSPTIEDPKRACVILWASPVPHTHHQLGEGLSWMDLEWFGNSF